MIGLNLYERFKIPPFSLNYIPLSNLGLSGALFFTHGRRSQPDDYLLRLKIDQKFNLNLMLVQYLKPQY